MAVEKDQEQIEYLNNVANPESLAGKQEDPKRERGTNIVPNTFTFF